MDRESSLERRYSFNIAQGNAVAESTNINGNSFSWGSSISSKHRSCSSLCLNDIQSQGLNNASSISCKPKNSTKIDARVAADIRSKGLASRIVKYHESGTRLNRSMSAHNLYSKPGHFPAVTLKKTLLPYRAAKQELSMIRIPPPEKSAFYGNTISSLLRSNSVVGMQSKRNGDLSRENKPIIHPPPTENDMAPTRSVLDVLKEISRKRINSDDSESEETTKKYCNRGGNDFVDTINNKMSAIQPNLVATTLSCQRYKRQRDCITPQQDVHIHETQTSPEQAKKRICNYNNDITSSLSSSMKWKRISASHNLNQSMPLNLESYEIQRSKVQRYQDHHKNNEQKDMRFENLEDNLKKVNAITPIPETPYAQQQNTSDVMPKRTVSEPVYNSDEKLKKNLTQPSGKPRLTLFNKKCDESEIRESNESLQLVQSSTDDSKELNDCAGIPFVKPKKITSKSGLRNPLMERTQKSKLALMLSGLRGELYINSDIDELDSTNDKEKLKINDDNRKDNSNAVISATKSTNTITPLTTVTSSSNVETPQSPNLSNFSTKTSSSPSSNSLTKKTTSPLVGLKLSLSTSSSENISNILSSNAIKSKESLSKTNIPVLSGFNFCTPNSTLVVNTTLPNNIVNDAKSTIMPTSSAPTNSSVLNFKQSTTSLALDEMNKSPPSTSTTIGSNSLNTVSTSTEPTSTSSTSTPFSGNSQFNITAKPNSVFNFTVPSTSSPTTVTSSVPMMFGIPACSATFATKTTSATISGAPTNAIKFSAPVISENLSGSTSMPSFTFDANKKTSSNEATTISSANSHCAFGINTCTVTKTQASPSTFSFTSDTKSINSSSGVQTNQEVSNQIGNNGFNSNTSMLFNSQCLKAEESAKSLENIFSSSNNTLLSFGQSSTKSGIQTFGSTGNNKSTISVTPTVFDGNSNNNSTLTFSFGSKSDISPTTSTNNISTAPGGFSFSKAISSSGENRTFGSNGQVNILNNTFSGVSASDSKNSLTFGSSTDKPDNSASIFGVSVNKQAENLTPQGGFSFGSAMPMKNTFTFGAGNNSALNTVTSSNNPSTGFAFGASPLAKPNEISNSKPFSFGPSQPTQQKQLATSNGSSLNIFGLTKVTETKQPAAFNFNSGSSQNLQSNTPTISNMFSPPPSNITTGPSDRPIRRATRRLQK